MQSASPDLPEAPACPPWCQSHSAGDGGAWTMLGDQAVKECVTRTVAGTDEDGSDVVVVAERFASLDSRGLRIGVTTLAVEAGRMSQAAAMQLAQALAATIAATGLRRGVA